MKIRILILSALLVTATAALVSAKSDPSGIIRLFSTNVAKPGNSPSWSNANLAGMRLRPAWQDIQSTSTSSDWTSVDEILALGAQYNKTIGLSVAAGVFSPQWVYDAGATNYALQDGSGLSMTIPWDPIFLAKWKDFVRAMGQRYDANPVLGYIVISGLGQNVETFLAQTAADDDALTVLGGPPTWISAAKEIITTYAEAFPTTPFFITAAKPFNTPDGISALQEVIDWGAATYPGRFGIMNASLNAKSNTAYYPNLAIATYHNVQPVGLQMLCSALLDPERLQGTLDQALTQGVLLGAKFVEVYQSDADQNSYQEILETQGKALQDNARPDPPQNLQITPN